MRATQIFVRIALLLALSAGCRAALMQPGENNPCNAGLMQANCQPWSSMGYDTSNLVTINCGICVEITGDADIVLPMGLDIIGRLRIAPPQDKRVKITTRAVLVQGVLSIDTPYYPLVDPTTGESATVNFVMTSTGQDFKYTPFGINSNACSGPCNAGLRPVVVAGGRLDINGLPDDCAAWKHLELVETGQVTDVQVGPSYVTPSAGCDLKVVDEDFEGTVSNWYGKDNAPFFIKNDATRGKYFEVIDRETRWQGVAMNLYNTTCIVPSETYLFSAYIKLHSNNVNASECSTTGEYCPYIGINRRDCPDESCSNVHSRIIHTNRGFFDQGDDVWYPITSTVTFSQEDIDGGEYYHYLFIEGPETGIDIAVDDMTIRRLPQAYFDANTCQDMIVNGDAEMDLIHPYPLYPNDPWRAAITVHQEQGNKFFKLTNRMYDWSTIRFYMSSQDCIVPSTTYTFSLRARASSALEYYTRLVYLTNDGNGGTDWNQIWITECKTGANVWQECSGAVTLSNPLIFQAQELFLEAPFFDDETSDVDFDDLRFTFREGSVDSFVVESTGVESCWQPGSKLLLTSDTMHFEHATVATIKDVQAYGSNGMTAISFEETLAPRSARQPQGFPIELAPMQRNIKFESDSDEKTQGGHLMVFQTGAVYQHLEGVELYHFGQRGVLGRYPMHIHLCEYLSAGTTFKRNFVHQSNQRCMIIHGSHNATIEENVAYESFGHCFMLEDGAEIDNRFIRNLGASQHNVEEEELVRDGESDDHSSTYWCTNPMNTWIDNVAAGGEGSGFWFEMKHDVKVPSIPVTEGPLFELNLTRFESNIAHSYRSNGLRTYPDGYRPIHRARFVDTRSYKNWDDGIFFHNSWNLGVYGGIVADNRRQIQIHRADNVIIEDVDVIGQTRAHHDALNREDGWGHCPSSWSSLYGITIHSFLFNNESPRGPTLRNVRISNINDHDSGCEDTAAIYMHEDEIQPTFDSWTLFDGLTFTDIGTKFSICEAVSQGVKSVIMEVTDNSMGSGPGFILSENQPEMVKFIPANSCTQMSEACAIFCTGVCLRTLKFKVEPTISPDMSLRVQSVASGDVIEVPGLVQGDDPTRTWTYRTYSVVLPAGDYNIAFVENGVQTWPTVVFEEMGDEPECNQDGSWTYTLAKPAPPAGFCDTLISDTVKNGDIEDGLDYWKHRGQGINVTQGGYRSSHALTTQRQDSNYFGQFLDTRCMQAGQEYQIEARVRIVNANGETVACDPNSNDWNTRCAYATIYSQFQDPETGEKDLDWHRVGQTIANSSTSGWSVLYGVFTVTQHMAQSSEVFLYFEGVPEYLWVDRVKLNMG